MPSLRNLCLQLMPVLGVMGTEYIVNDISLGNVVDSTDPEVFNITSPQELTCLHLAYTAQHLSELFQGDHSLILNKSLKFAARIVKLYQYLSKEKHETVISKQIIRSGTSIGANANEAVYGVSKAEFIAKLHLFCHIRYLSLKMCLFFA